MSLLFNVGGCGDDDLGGGDETWLIPNEAAETDCARLACLPRHDVAAITRFVNSWYLRHSGMGGEYK